MALSSKMKFSSRDLLLVTVIVAVGWGVDRFRLASDLSKPNRRRANSFACAAGAILCAVSAFGSHATDDLRASDPKPIAEIRGVPTRCFAFSPGGDSMALGGAADRGAMVTLLECGTWTQTATMTSAGRSANALAFSPTSPFLFLAVDSEVIAINLAKENAQTRLLRHTGTVFDIAVPPNSEVLATTGNDGQICIWDRKKLRHVLDLEKQEGPVYSVAFHPSGTEVVVAGQDVFRVWHRLAKGTSEAVRSPIVPSDALFLPDGKRIVGMSSTGEVVVAKLAHLSERPQLYDLGSFVDAFDCIAGSDLIVVGLGRDLALFDVARGKIIKRFRAFESRIRVVKCDPTRMRVAVGTWEGHFKVWDWSDLTGK